MVLPTFHFISFRATLSCIEEAHIFRQVAFGIYQGKMREVENKTKQNDENKIPGGILFY